MVSDVEALRIRFVSTKPEGWLTKFYKSKALKRDAEALYNIQNTFGYLYKATRLKRITKNWQNNGAVLLKS